MSKPETLVKKASFSKEGPEVISYEPEGEKGLRKVSRLDASRSLSPEEVQKVIERRKEDSEMERLLSSPVDHDITTKDLGSLTKKNSEYTTKSLTVQDLSGDLSCLSLSEVQSCDQHASERLMQMMAALKMEFSANCGIPLDRLEISYQEEEVGTNKHFLLTDITTGDVFHAKTPMHPSKSRASFFIEVATYDALEMLGYGPKNLSFIVVSSDGSKPIRNLMIVTADIANDSLGKKTKKKSFLTTKQQETILDECKVEIDFGFGFGIEEGSEVSVASEEVKKKEAVTEDHEDKKRDIKYNAHYTCLYFISEILGLDDVRENKGNIGERVSEDGGVKKYKPFIVDFRASPSSRGRETVSKAMAKAAIDPLEEEIKRAWAGEEIVKNDYFQGRSFFFNREVLEIVLSRLSEGKDSAKEDASGRKFSIEETFNLAYDAERIQKRYTNMDAGNKKSLDMFRSEIRDRLEMFKVVLAAMNIPTASAALRGESVCSPLSPSKGVLTQ